MAEQDIAEIEWVNGLIPMPPHLVELGTTVNHYTHEIRLLKMPVFREYKEGEVFAPEMTYEGIDWEKVPLAEPFTETRVWGQLV